ncbi:MAG: hypothetical protein A3G33_05760 [Omnitrophica bacterium RIFCSPLOWO2_12_FULL_44_17]|uniref:Uncharacterized protein n=1 Tax=Candidatus Danuiimicrobium aquiferis TaxID=1801832 RepID=A0A1G1L374_9BACT|nr:MAG: hypothetical protein A3B72_08305 [Omnitrophica bacterium RIFCSPHIGHO2_02_FULL_45_28]OGW90503.1 MAG: hypothetical protein A3E74_07615 [Omnitrophica bacterium RIFCSPHIGHO2_12_FULL_44_12]OGW99577.1 MAG: hypothetical protein A3G33_05760 [Omnitrophica bacterium RIFCSPLOWO2_12_FULL_44_17]OGX03612.1 MAG: hypothetical protein A3J12_05515 [Omnitrophica bacterium RIFCSPLOWO2_02_FULL_44_11]
METVFAIGLFGIALISLLTAIDYSLAMNKFAQNRSIAIQQVERVIERVRRKVNAIGLSDADEVAYKICTTSEAIGNYAINSTLLPWESFNDNLCPNGVSDPLPIKVTVSWTEKNRTVSHSVETKMTQRKLDL